MDATNPVASMTLAELEEDREALVREKLEAADKVDEIEKQMEVARLRDSPVDPDWLTRATVAQCAAKKRLRGLRARIQAVEARISRAKRSRNVAESAEERRHQDRCFVEAARAMLPGPTYAAVWKLAMSLERQRNAAGDAEAAVGLTVVR